MLSMANAGDCQYRPASRCRHAEISFKVRQNFLHETSCTQKAECCYCHAMTMPYDEDGVGDLPLKYLGHNVALGYNINPNSPEGLTVIAPPGIELPRLMPSSPELIKKTLGTR